MNLTSFNRIKEQTERQIESGAPHDAIARDAERACGKAQIEFHPLVCDIVEAAFPVEGKPIPKCRHTSGAGREAAEADFATSEEASTAPPKAAKKK